MTYAAEPMAPMGPAGRMSWTELLFSFSGRINRAKYWGGGLAVALIVIIVYAVLLTVFFSSFSPGIIILMVIIYIPVLWAGLAITVKRLHDREKSGWFVLLFIVLPAALQGIGDSLMDSTAIIFYVASLGFSLWGLVELGFLAGTNGPNQYGPDPIPIKIG